MTTQLRSGQDQQAVLRFGRYALHLGPRQLFADGTAVPIGSRAFDLLEQLVRHAGRPVSSEDLLRSVWADRRVGSNNLRIQISALRKLLGDDVIAHHTIRGYRFTLPVQDETDAVSPDAPAIPGNLPMHLPPLYGRDADRQALSALLAGQARVTLAGPAGMGKSTLARAAAHDQRQRFADGVWWVELAALTEPAQFAYSVAALLQVKLRGNAPMDELARALGSQRLLLVLDNCEHLGHAACHLADALLRQAPHVAVLATSRVTLKFAGEQVLRLGPLALPDEAGLGAARRSGAVALFEARARRADPGFALTEANADAVADICAQLDGVALAIGLAAARVPLLGVAGLRERLSDRLRLLTSREPDARGHPQALSAALDWSHGLLAPAEQAVLRRLGVFAGSFGLASAQALVGDSTLDEWAVLDAMTALVDHSLLISDSAALQSMAPARYTLHESVRLYARTRLDDSGEAAALRERHARHLLALVVGPGLAGAPPAPRERMVVRLPDADHDNLRAALAWAAEHDIELGLRLACAANAYMRLRCHHLEARRLGQALLADARTAAYPLLIPRLRLALTALCYEQNDLEASLQHAAAALAVLAELPDDPLLGEAHSWVGIVHLVRREFGLAEPALRRSLACERAVGNQYSAASQLNNIGLLMVELQRHGEAKQLLLEALALNRQLDVPWAIGITLENLGEAAYAEGDYPVAQAYWLEALTLLRQLGHRYHEAQLLQYRAQALRRIGHGEAALAELRASLVISLQQRLQGLVADALIVLAGLAIDRGDARRAAVLLRVAERERGDAQPIGPVAIDLPGIHGATRSALSDADWQIACAEGERLTAEQAAA